MQNRVVQHPRPPVKTVRTSVLRKGLDWKLTLLGELARPNAPRVLTASELHHRANTYRPGASVATSVALSDLLVTAGALRRVSSGIFLNLRAVPPTEVMEAADRIRAGAVISLHSVLGESGFLNNPSSIVTAVVPTSVTKRPRLGTVKTSSGDVFRFYGLAEKFFPTSAEERYQMLQPGRPCGMFRPEAALLHWLHLASMKRSSLTAPPVDVDMDQLDMELLMSLADRWGIARQLQTWLAGGHAANFGQETDTDSPRSEAPSAESWAASNAARARLMARRTSPK